MIPPPIPSIGEICAEVIDALGDGELRPEDARALVATLLDAAVPTGPADPLDGPVWHLAVEGVWSLLARRRTADALLEAADRAASEGRASRAIRLRRRAARRGGP